MSNNQSGPSSAMAPAPPQAQGATASGIVVLFGVKIRHNYYNLADDKCPDFAIAPTSDCAALMENLGIQFCNQSDGFTVYCPRSRLTAITNYITNTFCSATPGYGYWARLSFLLVAKNPNFVGITALPLTTCPTQQNLYVNNLQTIESDGQLLFGDGTSVGANALYPVTGPSVSIQTTMDATVTIADLSGQAVCSTTTTAGTATSLSLAGSPYDYYTVSSIPSAAYGGPPSLVYVATRPLSSGLIDLLLTQPAAGVGNPAAFPITPPASIAATPNVQPVNMVLSFDARKTTWQYYVVSQGERGRLAPNLSITGSGATFEQSKEPVALPSGELAIQFSSTTPLQLQQRTTYRFKLSGQRQGPNGSRDDISVDRLPGAPATPVWPTSTGDPSSGTSEIFVYV